MTAIATLIFENEAEPMSPAFTERYRAAIAAQLNGIDRLDGTYPYTLERSARGYRLNRFLHTLVSPDVRARFRQDEEHAMLSAGLTDEERTLVLGRDWRALIRYGAIFFLLEKLGAAIGVTNLHIYAAMRGESLEAFQQTRRHSVLYSVAVPDDTNKGSVEE
jgi:gallate dioxygenase